jgi:hypothetical protein
MNEGSHVGNAALTELARGIGIPSDALKVVLEEAFGMMKENDDPVLALRIALARRGYTINYPGFHEQLRIFRSVFRSASQGMETQDLFNICADSEGFVPASNYPTTQMQPNPQPLAMAHPHVAYPTPQYTPDAMTWRAGFPESQVPRESSNLRPTASRYTPENAISQPTSSNHYFGPNMET